MSNTLVRLFMVTLVAFQTVVNGFGSFDKAKGKCPRFQIKKNTIIKTQASKAKGAIYIESTTLANSHGCYEACCNKEDCNLVLLKFNTNNRVTCFMFNCGSPSKCLFHTHSSYRNYAALQFEDREVDDSPFPTTRERYTLKEAATEVHTTPSHLNVAHDRSTQHRWHFKVAKTTEENRDWLHYHDTMVPSTSAPNSDSQFDHTMKTNNDDGDMKLHERKLEFTSSQKSFTDESFVTTTAPAAVDWNHGTKKETSYQGYDGSESTFDRSHKASDLATVNYPTTDNSNIGTEPKDESFERRVWLDHNPDYPNKPKSHFHSPSSTSILTKASTKRTETSFIINKFNIQQNKAVIPLAVGLVIALLLLLAVIFRMRTSRRRRTKAFLTDDADYLINGMYL